MGQESHEVIDAVLVGAGIMSATLGTLLKELDPQMSLEIVEGLAEGACESSNPWNNAGTGHAGLCELNYTPENAQGQVESKKAVAINCMFEVSKQFWAYLVDHGAFTNPQTFINPIPHLSYVSGEKSSAYLKKRFETLRQHHCFETMAFSDAHSVLEEWMPLMMAGRPVSETICASRVEHGSDVNFGALTRQLLSYVGSKPDVKLAYQQRVVGLKREANHWLVTVKQESGAERQIRTRFVFLGAGGGALPLLQISGIPEGKGYGGFPVSGQWLRCDNQEVVTQHQAKVYSLADVGSPPMSVPHLDTRVVDGKKSLLFGPYAGFSTKFLKSGSYLDIFRSIKPSNLGAMLSVGRDNMDLTRYLIKEVLQSKEQRLASLRKFYPRANAEDWRLEVAGQRVQIIKPDSQKGGKLEFGTEIVAASDGSLAALLGASPGASVSVSAMLDLLDRCFAERVKSPEWQARLGEIFRARGPQLEQDANLYRDVSAASSARLQLKH